MINKNGTYFKKFAPKQLFTEYIYSLMKQKKNFMVFPDNKQVLIDEEVDEWNMVNGITDSTERLIYHRVGNDGYVVNYTEGITTVMVPVGLIEKSYDDFIKQCEEDVNYRMN